MDEYTAGDYRKDLLKLVQDFAYELCEECGQDVDKHIFSPDPLGKPHAWCVGGYYLGGVSEARSEEP